MNTACLPGTETDVLTRVDLLLRAVNIATDDNAEGDPDAILFDDGVVHPSLSTAVRREWFASLIEATKNARAARGSIADGCGHFGTAHERCMVTCANDLDAELDRGLTAVCALLGGEPDVGPGVDAETLAGVA